MRFWQLLMTRMEQVQSWVGSPTGAVRHHSSRHRQQQGRGRLVRCPRRRWIADGPELGTIPSAAPRDVHAGRRTVGVSIEQRSVGAQQPHLVAGVVQRQLGVPTEEQQEPARLDDGAQPYGVWLAALHRCGRGIRRGRICRIIQHPASQVDGLPAAIVQLNPLVVRDAISTGWTRTECSHSATVNTSSASRRVSPDTWASHGRIAEHTGLRPIAQHQILWTRIQADLSADPVANLTLRQSQLRGGIGTRSKGRRSTPAPLQGSS